MASMKFIGTSIDTDNSYSSAESDLRSYIIGKRDSTTSWSQQITLPTGVNASLEFYINMDFSQLPKNIRIDKVTLNTKTYTTVNTYGTTQYGLCIGAGNFIGQTLSDNTSTTATSIVFTEGISPNDLDNLKFGYKMQRGSSNNNKNRRAYTRFYGFDVTIEYTVIPEEIYIKSNNEYILCKGAYKKVNGNWVEQTNFAELLTTKPNWILKKNE